MKKTEKSAVERGVEVSLALRLHFFFVVDDFVNSGAFAADEVWQSFLFKILVV